MYTGKCTRAKQQESLQGAGPNLMKWERPVRKWAALSPSLCRAERNPESQVLSCFFGRDNWEREALNSGYLHNYTALTFVSVDIV